MGKRGYEGVVTTPEQTKKGVKLNWTGRVNLVKQALEIPLKIKKPTMFFVDSMSDLFHEEVPFEFIDKTINIIQKCPQHIFQILTKRADRANKYFLSRRWPIYIPNIWLGASVEQKKHLPRIDILRQIPAAIRILSLEPLLEDLGEINLKDIHWVIVGGESGPGARPMHPDWVRSIRDQCKTANVPFFFKQWGSWCPEQQSFHTIKDISQNDVAFMNKKERKKCHCWENGLISYKLGKSRSGHLLDGKEYKEFPKT